MRTVGLTLAGLVALALAADTTLAADGPKHPAQVTVAAQFGTVGLGTIHEVRHYGPHGHPRHGHYEHGHPRHGYHYYPHYVPRYYAPYPVYPRVPTYRYPYYVPYRGFQYSGPHVSFGIDF